MDPSYFSNTGILQLSVREVFTILVVNESILIVFISGLSHGCLVDPGWVGVEGTRPLCLVLIEWLRSQHVGFSTLPPISYASHPSTSSDSTSRLKSLPKRISSCSLWLPCEFKIACSSHVLVRVTRSEGFLSLIFLGSNWGFLHVGDASLAPGLTGRMRRSFEAFYAHSWLEFFGVFVLGFPDVAIGVVGIFVFKLDFGDFLYLCSFATMEELMGTASGDISGNVGLWGATGPFTDELGFESCAKCLRFVVVEDWEARKVSKQGSAKAEEAKMSMGQSCSSSTCNKCGRKHLRSVSSRGDEGWNMNDGSLICHCRENCVLRTTKTIKNRGKKFWGCPRYKGIEESVSCEVLEANDERLVKSFENESDKKIVSVQKVVMCVQSWMKFLVGVVSVLCVLNILIIAMLMGKA
ncbi:hypothetical protein V8G54_009688 [Vigna mungo]|uniref:GRF-type domain-containing protein n=1 Tax=Vigna mungo TaxID=3915 RepID=A0AAQ3NUG5_VIGMU